MHPILSQDIINFISDHPGKALGILAHHHRAKKSGDGIQGSGIFKDAWKSIKKIGKKIEKKIIKPIYHVAEKFYDYTNGLPLRGVEYFAKKVFKTDLNDYKTFRDFKKVYGYATGDPRKYKEIYNAVKDPKKTLRQIKKYVVPALQGIRTGPQGMVAGVAAAKLGDDIRSDIDKITGGENKIPAKLLNFIHKNPTKARNILDHFKHTRSGKGISDPKGGRGWKKALAIATGVTAGVGLMLYGYVKENPRMIGQVSNAISMRTGRGLKLAGQGTRTIPLKYQKFITKNPLAAKKIIKALKNHTTKGGTIQLAGHGIGSKIKNVLAVAGVVGIVGALAFTKWYFKLKTSDNKADTKMAYHISKAIAKGKYDLITGIASKALKMAAGTGKDFNLKHPEIAKQIRVLLKRRGLDLQGGFKITKKGIKKALLLAGIPIVAGAVGYAFGLKKGSTKLKYDDDEMWGQVGPDEAAMLGYGVKKVGNKKEVWQGIAHMTGGRLKKMDLIKNGRGKIVSRRKSELGKLNYAKIKGYAFSKKK